MELEELFKNRSEEAISAFAYNTGRLMEHIVDSRIGSIKEENEVLRAKILEYRNKLAMDINDKTVDDILVEEYEIFFGIQKL